MPGAQADFDDLRVTEKTDAQTDEHRTHTEIVGARPHSDSDLTNVVAYWKMNGDGKAVDGINHAFVSSAKPTTGRFGETNGALEINNGHLVLKPSVGDGFKAYTFEAWVRPNKTLDATTLRSEFTFRGSAPGKVSFYVNHGAAKGKLQLGMSVVGGPPGGCEWNSEDNVILAAGRWHHVAASWSAAESGALYVDGVKLDTVEACSGGKPTQLQPVTHWYLGKRPVANDSPFPGAMDEVLFHDVARSADYFAKRARGLPRLRFLAHTREKAENTGLFKSHDYTLRWGNAAAKGAQTKVVGLDKKTACDGLLSPCLGYAGWWRFDDGDVSTAWDSSTARRHLPLVEGNGNMKITAAPDGLARSSTAGAKYFRLSAGIAAAQYTLEGVGRQDTNNNASLIRIADTQIELSNGIARAMVIASPTVTKPTHGNTGGWRNIAGVFGAGKVTAVLNGTASETAPCLNGKCPVLATTDSLQLGLSAGSGNRIAMAQGRIMVRALAADELLHLPLLTHGLQATAPLKECDDGNVCTTDVVIPGGGCVAKPTTSIACDLAGKSGVCGGGVCKQVTACPLGVTKVETAANSTFRSAVVLPDGTAITLGENCCYPTNDTVLARRDANLKAVWSVKIGKSHSGDTALRSMELFSDHVRLSTTSYSDARLLRYSLDGKQLSSVTVKGTGIAFNHAVNSHGDIMFVGRTTAPVARFTLATSTGAPIATVSGLGSGGGVAFDVLAVDTDFIGVGAHTSSVGWSGDSKGSAIKTMSSATRAFSTKLTDKGKVVWTRKYDTIAAGVLRVIKRQADGSFVTAGHATGTSREKFITLLARLGPNGQLLWQKTYTQGNLYSLNLTPNGDILLSGKTLAAAPFQVRKLAPDGAQRWLQSVDFKSGNADAVHWHNGHVHAYGQGIEAAGGKGFAARVILDAWGNTDCTKSGLCAFAKNACDDEDACTADSCDPSKGCVYTPVNGCQKPEDMDLDHDGLVGKADKCPTAWSPDNDVIRGSSSCEAFDGKGWSSSSSAGLGEPGLSAGWSAMRRTNEPVELPLVNGILDKSVIAYWPLTGGLKDVVGNSGDAIVGNGPTWVAGPFGASSKGLAVTKTGDQLVAPLQDLRKSGDFAVSVWFRATGTNNGTRVFGTNTGADTFQLELSGGELRLLSVVNGTKVIELKAPVGADKSWHHVAASVSTEVVRLFVDGELAATGAGSSKAWFASSGFGFGGLKLDGGTGVLKGEIGDPLLFRRTLSYREIATYYASKAAYGSANVPSAQADFDDVRVTENTDVQPWDHATHAEIIGARPHSDTDLEDVVAYWKLDGDGKDVTGKHNATPTNTKATTGRFGQKGGALNFDGTARLESASAAGAMAGLKAFTLEAWVFQPADQDGAVSIARAGLDSGHVVVVMQTMGKLTGYPDNVFNCSLRTDKINGSSVATTHKTDGPSLAVGAWSHLACVYDGQTLRAFVNGFSAGAENATGAVLKPDTNFFIGAKTANKSLWKGAIDEVIVHKVAKSADYIAKRAIGLPRVRFLAHTRAQPSANGAYKFHNYKLWWDNQAAKSPQTRVVSGDKKTVCAALLSPCLGYAGWWRFDDLSSGQRLDQTSHRHFASVVKGTSPVAGISGPGLQLNGKNNQVEIPHAAHLQLNHMTVEASVQPVADANKVTSALVNKGVNSQPQGFNYMLYLHTGTNVWGRFEGNDGVDVEVTGKLSPATEWSPLAMTYDGQQLSLANSGITFAKLAKTATLGANTNPIRIGHHVISNGTLNDRFAGTIDEFRLMNRALSTDELLHFPLATHGLQTPPPK